MIRPKFFLIEPSKVGSQHITLLGGFLKALSESTYFCKRYDLIFCSSIKTRIALGSLGFNEIIYKNIFVMNPENKRLIVKSFIELFVVLRKIIYAKRRDIIFISCLLPTTFYMLEFFNFLFRKKNIYVVLHDEVEWILSNTKNKITSFGFWSSMWLNKHSKKSNIKLVVLDDFIRDKLLDKFPEKFQDNCIYVIHHPIFTFEDAHTAKLKNSICFIGYKTKKKGFSHFIEIAKKNTKFSFLSIGGGQVSMIGSEAFNVLPDNNSYLGRIAECKGSVFPYMSGYECSLSAAALDALSCGVPILATDLPFFVHLNKYFGTQYVRVFNSPEDIGHKLNTSLDEMEKESRQEKLNNIQRSKYGIKEVSKSFDKLLASH